MLGRSGLAGIVLGAVAGLVLAALPAPAQVLERVTEKEKVNQVIASDGEVWIAADSGAYRVAGDSVQRIPSDFQINAIAEVGSSLWLGSTGGLFQIARSRLERIFLDEIGSQNITLIEELGERTWIGTTRSLYFSQADAVSSTEVRGPVQVVREIAGEVWVVTRRNAFRLDPGGRAAAVFDRPFDVLDIVAAGASIWIIEGGLRGRSKAVYRSLEDAFAEFYPPPGELHTGLEILSISEIAGEVWFATTDGPYRLVDDTLESYPVACVDGPVNTIASPGDSGDLWIGTTRNLCRASGGQAFQIPSEEDRVDVEGLALFGDSLWAWGSTGAYRLDPRVEELSGFPRVRQLTLFVFLVILAAVLAAFLSGRIRNRG